MRARGVVLVAWVGGLLISGCAAPVGSKLKVPQDAATQCAEHCASIGMVLSAVAIMANNVGCVCQPQPGTASASEYSAATAGGISAILMEKEAQEQRAMQQQ